MDNVQTKVEGNKLTIEIDLSQNFGDSESGKSITVASTRGGVKLDGADGVVLSVNCYRPLPKQPKQKRR